MELLPSKDEIMPAPLTAFCSFACCNTDRSCVHLFVAIRTGAVSMACESDRNGDLIQAAPSDKDRDLACASTAHEQTADYDLLFVEFDDQGMLYRATEQERRRQIEVGRRNLRRQHRTG